MNRTVAILGVAVFLLGAGGAGIALTEAESGRTIEGAIGQEVVVTLRTNPTTGYSWSSRVSPPEALKPAGEPEYMPDQPAMTGSGGRMRYRFTMVSGGKATLRFEYRRPWEHDIPPAKTVAYVFSVRKP
jgi:inhibitor of cysteine peptidase